MSSCPEIHKGKGFPERIVCLTEETTELLYLLGEQDRIAGISVYTVRPAIAAAEKPGVCDFTGVNMDKIRELKPDLILGFSDVQAEAAKQLIKAGFQVMVFNQRSVEDIFRAILLTGSIVGRYEEACELSSGYRHKLLEISRQSAAFDRKPKIFFEEWYSPLISGIRWVSELIEIAGGIDCFPELSVSAEAKGRMIADEAEVVRRNPDIILASWCGKRFIREKITSRKGWDQINAVRQGSVFEIDSSVILQPGPAALTDGIDQLFQIVENWHKIQS
jgi:iron complex transport system substrate-binding protein